MYALFLLVGLFALNSCDEGPVIIDEPDTDVVTGMITENVTWTADKVYYLANKVVVGSGVTLTIEPGTIIKGKRGTGSLASALIVAQGGKIMAEGTAEAPIIFTSELDNIEIGQKVGTNLDQSDRELWGGLIILGKAPVSAENGDIEAQIEGIPADETFGKYGGSDANDNSGVLKYVSIRHGGALIGEGNEINGLTLGGVGSGTAISYVEVVGNLDDGIECFGGTVNLSNVLVAFQGDDGIDIDQNYSGTIDNFMVIHGGDTDEGLEIDGPEGSTYTNGLFTLKNGTVMSNDGSGSAGDFKSKAQGTVTNVVFAGYTTWIKVRANFDANNACASKTDAYSHMVGGTPTLEFTNNEMLNGPQQMSDVIAAYTSVSSCAASLDANAQTALVNTFVSGGNAVVTTASKGANKTAFDGWSWTSINGIY